MFWWGGGSAKPCSGNSWRWSRAHFRRWADSECLTFEAIQRQQWYSGQAWTPRSHILQSGLVLWQADSSKKTLTTMLWGVLMDSSFLHWFVKRNKLMAIAGSLNLTEAHCMRPQHENERTMTDWLTHRRLGLLSGPSSNIGQKTGHWGLGDCKQPEVIAIFSPCSWQRHRASCLQVIHEYIVSGHKLSLVSQSNSCMLSCDFNGQNGLFSCRLRSSEPSVQSSQRQKCLEVVVLEECYLRCRYMFVSAQWSCRSCAKKKKYWGTAAQEWHNSYMQ